MTSALALWFGGFFRGESPERPRRHIRDASSVRSDESRAARLSASDTDLARRIQSGERVAFDSLVERYFSILARYAYHIVRSRDEAEDVAQDVLVDVWNRRERWNPSGSIQAYLLTAARHRALNRLRRSAVEDRHAPDAVTVLHSSDVTLPSQSVIASDINRVLDAALGRLPDRTRQVVLLRYVSECTFPEVAAALNISLSAAQKLAQRGVARLRELLAGSD